MGISALVIVTPGQDTALTIRNTLLGGSRAGIFTALGVAALLIASEPAFLALRVAGAAYLLLLGAQALRAALRPAPLPPPREHDPAPERPRTRAAYRQGALSNLGNPKMAVFFTSLLPAFAPPGPGAFAVLLALGALFCLLTLLWLTAYALAVARSRGFLLRPRVRRALDAVTGTVLVGLGLRIAATER